MWRRVEIAAKLMLPFLIIFGLLLRRENAYIEDTSYLDDSKGKFRINARLRKREFCNSQLSLNGHLYKTDTYIRRTPL